MEVFKHNTITLHIYYNRYVERVLKNGKPITCKELNITFLTVTEATLYMRKVYGINCPTSNLTKTCKGKRNKCGTIMLNNVKTDLHWYYAKDTNND